MNSEPVHKLAHSMSYSRKKTFLICYKEWCWPLVHHLRHTLLIYAFPRPDAAIDVPRDFLDQREMAFAWEPYVWTTSECIFDTVFDGLGLQLCLVPERFRVQDPLDVSIHIDAIRQDSAMLSEMRSRDIEDVGLAVVNVYDKNNVAVVWLVEATTAVDVEAPMFFLDKDLHFLSLVLETADFKNNIAISNRIRYLKSSTNSAEDLFRHLVH